MKGPDRDKRTGRYKHVWGVIWHDPETHREIAECQVCPMVWAYGAGRPDRKYKDLEAARGPERIPAETY